MKRTLILLLAISSGTIANGQNNPSLEISLYTHYDKHADYTSRFGNRSFTDDIELWGLSNRLQIHYWQPVMKGLKAGIGLGYHKIGINKVKITTTQPNEVEARMIDYTFPSGIKPAVSTNNYHYNNLSVSAGLQYELPLSKNFFLTAGTEFNYLYTFSQRYRIPWDGIINYKPSDRRQLGFNVNASLGFLKKIWNNKYYVNPTLVLTLYQHLNGDKAFRESENVKMTKQFNGAGISIALGKYF